MFNAGFVLGFVVALAIVGAAGRLIGAARLARVFGALAGRRTVNRSTNAGRPVAVPTAVEADVIAALVNLKASGAVARQATAEAAQYLRRYKVAPEFDALFNAALATIRSGKKGVA
jgi:hypothetical protein